MYEKLERCPLCESIKITNHYICKDHAVSGESFALSICLNCDLIFTNPRPASAISEKYYNSDSYIPHTTKNNPFTQLYRIIRNINTRNKLNLIAKYSPKGSCLDVGCGTGDFLEKCRMTGREIAGVEPSERAGEISSKRLGIPVYRDLAELPKGLVFENITFWHVLEHIYDLHETVDRAKKLLDRSGRLYVALPNVNSFDSLLYKESWAAYDVPRHLYHFNQETFGYLVHAHGMKIDATVPLKFDAYYICLLSEQYRTGRRKWIRSFINGYKSNSYAKNHGNNYSSLLYIIKK
jgi:2-polyprenyl-3-methyl-5-hydroxy-6-metoxy-1,4-benzoquinol methylase